MRILPGDGDVRNGDAPPGVVASMDGLESEFLRTIRTSHSFLQSFTSCQFGSPVRVRARAAAAQTPARPPPHQNRGADRLFPAPLRPPGAYKRDQDPRRAPAPLDELRLEWLAGGARWSPAWTATTAAARPTWQPVGAETWVEWRAPPAGERAPFDRRRGGSGGPLPHRGGGPMRASLPSAYAPPTAAGGYPLPPRPPRGFAAPGLVPGAVAGSGGPVTARGAGRAPMRAVGTPPGSGAPSYGPLRGSRGYTPRGHQPY
ncbi:hypothetical protein HK405_016031 [Cladochytrium tenue]|nr:hypothetical protein HK405_016031 [Cladochytrium tenue]